MASTSRPHHLPEFALKLVRARARELSRRRIIPAYERRDIEQHFLLELWRRWRRFDGSRGGLPGFVVRIIDNSAADLIGRHASPGRVWPPQFVSLHRVVCDDDGDIATVGDGLSEDQALWQVPSNEFDAADLRVDLGRAVECLPSRLQDLCRRLRSQSIARDRARDEDIPWLSLCIRRHDPSELSGGRVASLPRRCTRIREIGAVVHPHRSDPHVSKPLHPDLMTAAERLDEIAEILAAGILRVRRRRRENKFSYLEKVRLDFSPTRSGHARLPGHRRRRA